VCGPLKTFNMPVGRLHKIFIILFSLINMFKGRVVWVICLSMSGNQSDGVVHLIVDRVTLYEDLIDRRCEPDKTVH